MISSLLGLFENKHHQHFDEHGYVILGNLLSGAELSGLRRRAEDLMMGRTTIPGVTFQLDGKSEEYALEARTVGPTEKTVNYRRIDELHNDPLYLDYMQHPVFRLLTRHYIGEDISIFRSMFMNKPAKKGTMLPWHQDVGAGWGIDATPTTTVWTALDDTTVENGCVQIVPGSHKLGILNEGHFTSKEDQVEYCKPEKVIDLEVGAGEAVVWEATVWEAVVWEAIVQEAIVWEAVVREAIVLLPAERHPRPWSGNQFARGNKSSRLGSPLVAPSALVKFLISIRGAPLRMRCHPCNQVRLCRCGPQARIFVV